MNGDLLWVLCMVTGVAILMWIVFSPVAVGAFLFTFGLAGMVRG